MATVFPFPLALLLTAFFFGVVLLGLGEVDVTDDGEVEELTLVTGVVCCFDGDG